MTSHVILLFLIVSEVALTLFLSGVSAVRADSGEYWRRLGARYFREDRRTGPSTSSGVLSYKVCIIIN